MKKFLWVLVAMLPLALGSCGGDELGDDRETWESYKTTISSTDRSLYERLMSTTWRLESTNMNLTCFENPQARDMFVNGVISLTSAYKGNGAFILTCDKMPGVESRWWIKDGKATIYLPGYHFELGKFQDGTKWSINDWVSVSTVIGAQKDISFYSDGKMKLSESGYSGLWGIYIPATSGSGNNNSNGGSGSHYEKPDVGFDDFTATNRSITVYYRLYNQESCGDVTSAYIYYGKSSASSKVSASVNGVVIKTTISGLSPATSYYVKCAVTSKGGTATSSQTKVTTLP